MVNFSGPGQYPAASPALSRQRLPAGLSSGAGARPRRPAWRDAARDLR